MSNSSTKISPNGKSALISLINGLEEEVVGASPSQRIGTMLAVEVVHKEDQAVEANLSQQIGTMLVVVEMAEEVDKEVVMTLTEDSLLGNKAEISLRVPTGVTQVVKAADPITINTRSPKKTATKILA